MSALPVPDCRTCGACCHDASDGRVLVSAADIVRWRRTSRDDIADALVPGHFGERGLPADGSGRCLFLRGDGERFTCGVYETRGEACRALEPGSPQCLSYRRGAGLG